MLQVKRLQMKRLQRKCHGAKSFVATSHISNFHRIYQGTSDQSNKPFFLRHRHPQLISQSVCPQQSFTLYSDICKTVQQIILKNAPLWLALEISDQPEMFCHGQTLQLIVSDEEKSFVVLTPMAWALPTNIRLGRKNMPGTNTLAYYEIP